MKQIHSFSRLTCLLLLLCVLAGSLASCQQLLYLRYEETEGTTAVGSSAVVTRDISTPPGLAPDFGIHPDKIDSGFSDAADAVPGLHKEDLNGFSFLVCTVTEANNTVLPEETSPLFASYARRNELITDAYGNTFYCSEDEMANVRKDLAASVKAGGDAASYYADMVEVPAADAYSLITAGLLLNLRSLPFYTVGTAGTEGAGFYRNAKNCFDTRAATNSPTDTYCLYCNTELLGNDTANRLSLAALNDSLTFETLLTAAQDAAGNAVPYDITGNFPAGQFANLAFVRAGNRYTDQVGGYPQLTPVLTASEEADALLSSLRALRWFGFTPAAPEIPVDSSAVASSAVAPQPEPNGYEQFASGKALFYVGTVGEMESLTAIPHRWGLLPLPKDAPEAENVERNRSVFCVPANNTRLEMTGLMLTALDKVSGSWIGKEYASYAVLHCLRDNASYFTLCKIFESASFCDFAELCGAGCKNLTAATYDAVSAAMVNSAAISATAKPLQTAVNNALKKLN